MYPKVTGRRRIPDENRVSLAKRNNRNSRRCGTLSCAALVVAVVGHAIVASDAADDDDDDDDGGMVSQANKVPFCILRQMVRQQISDGRLPGARGLTDIYGASRSA